MSRGFHTQNKRKQLALGMSTCCSLAQNVNIKNVLTAPLMSKVFHTQRKRKRLAVGMSTCCFLAQNDVNINKCKYKVATDMC